MLVGDATAPGDAAGLCSALLSASALTRNVLSEGKETMTTDGDVIAGRSGAAFSEGLAKEFYLEEYKCLRSEIERRSHEQLSTERLVLVAIAAIYTVSATLPQSRPLDPQFAKSLWVLPLIPVILSALGLFRWWGNHETIERMACYIKRYECRNNPTLRGWEHYLDENPVKLDLPTLYIWILFFVCTIIIASWITISRLVDIGVSYEMLYYS
jgi:hypothetical protein